MQKLIMVAAAVVVVAAVAIGVIVFQGGSRGTDQAAPPLRQAENRRPIVQVEQERQMPNVPLASSPAPDAPPGAAEIIGEAADEPGESAAAVDAGERQLVHDEEFLTMQEIKRRNREVYEEATKFGMPSDYKLYSLTVIEDEALRLTPGQKANVTAYQENFRPRRDAVLDPIDLDIERLEQEKQITDAFKKRVEKQQVLKELDEEYWKGLQPLLTPQQIKAVAGGDFR